jgi:hypothetical protein
MKASIRPVKTGVLLLLATAILWSLGGLWVKFIDWNPVAIAGARSLIAFLVIAAVMPKALGQLTWGAVPGAIAYAAVMFLFVLATKLTTAANAVFRHYTAPIHILSGRGCWANAPAGVIGCSAQIRRQLHEFAAKGVIPPYGVPERIVLVEALPKTSVGKLDKKVLRGRYAQ